MIDARRDRVVLVTLHYAPERNFITTDLAAALSERFDVRVITAQPNYPSGRIAPGFQWYGWGSQAEGSVVVTRVPTYAYRGLRILGRAASYLTFSLFAGLSAITTRRAPRLWIVYQTPFIAAWGVVVARILRGGRVVHVVADLWPESMVAAGVLSDGPLLRFVALLRRWTNRQADHLIVTTEGMRRRFVAEGVAAERMTLISLWTDAQRELRAPRPDPATPPYVVYAGRLGPSQPLEPLLEAIGSLQRQGVRIGARIAGEGAHRAALEARAAALGLRAVEFLGPVAPSEVTDLVRRAVAQVVPLARHAEFADTVPSKLFGAIGAGVPILAGLEGEARGLAVESGLGFAYPSDNATELAGAIQRVLALDADGRRALAERAWEFYQTRLAPAAGLERILKSIEHVASHDGVQTR